MLDGLQNEKKAYRARKIIDIGNDKATSITLNFMAHNDEEAQRFLEDENYDGYELINEEG